MAVVTKHDCEEEGECNDSEHCGVGFTVAGDTVGVCNQLWNINDIIAFKIGGRRVKHGIIFVLAPWIETNLGEFAKSDFYKFFLL